ncbi:MAG: DUF952 domain-containing protein [Hyphomicrobiaceae bacterium]
MTGTGGERLFKILRTGEWETFRTLGRFEGSHDDLRDGYIHLCTGRQLPATLARHFKDDGTLVLAQLRADGMATRLRWEPARGDELFPHLYAPLMLGDVIGTIFIERGGDGRHALPDEVG